MARVKFCQVVCALSALLSTASAQTVPPGAGTEGYIIELSDPPLLEVFGSHERAANEVEREAREASDSRRIALERQAKERREEAVSAIKRHEETLNQHRREVESRLASIGVRVRAGAGPHAANSDASQTPWRQLKNVANAMYVEASEDLLDSIAALPGVKAIHRNSRVKSQDGGDNPNETPMVENARTRAAQELKRAHQKIDGTGVSIAVLDTGLDYQTVRFGNCDKARIEAGLCPKIPIAVDVYNTFDIDDDGNTNGCFERVVGTYPSCTGSNCYCEGDCCAQGDFFCDDHREWCEEDGRVYFMRNRNGTVLGDDCYRKVDPEVDAWPCASGRVAEKDNDPEEVSYAPVRHGSVVSAIAAGMDAGEKGVAPGAFLYFYKISHAFDVASSVVWGPELAEDYQGFADLFSALKAMDEAVDPRNSDAWPHVINISQSPFAPPRGSREYPFSEDLLNRAIDRVVVDARVVVVAAAGNYGPDPEFAARDDCYVYPSSIPPGNTASICGPGASREALTVGMTDGLGRVHDRSSRGPACVNDSCTVTVTKPDLVARGLGTSLASPGGPRTGTSYAAPQVAGAAALLMQAYQELKFNPVELKNKIRDNAIPLGLDANQQGRGELDVLGALANSLTVTVITDGPARVKSTSAEEQTHQLNCGDGMEPGNFFEEPSTGCQRWFLDREQITLRTEETENEAVDWQPGAGIECLESALPTLCIIDEGLTQDAEINVEIRKCSSLDPFTYAEEEELWQQCGPDIVAEIRQPIPSVGQEAQEVTIPFRWRELAVPTDVSQVNQYEIEVAVYSLDETTGKMTEKILDQIEVPTIGTGERSQSVTWTPEKGGVYMLYVAVDALNDIEESGEGNNYSTLIYEVKELPKVRVGVKLDGTSHQGAVTGTITADNNTTLIDCPGNCQATVPKDAHVQLTASDSVYAHFTGWTDSSAVHPTPCNGQSSKTCNFTASYHQTPTALFNSKQVVVSATSSNGGSGRITSTPSGINCSDNAGTCHKGFAIGQSITLTASPSGGSRFVRWALSSSHCGGSGSAVCSLTVPQSGDVNIIAEFEKKPQGLLAVGTRAHFWRGEDDSVEVINRPGSVRTMPGLTPGVGNKICTSGTCATWHFDVGKEVALKANAYEGAEFLRWEGACTHSEEICRVQITNSPKTLRARFDIEQSDLEIDLDISDVPEDDLAGPGGVSYPVKFQLDSWGRYLHATIRCETTSYYGLYTCPVTSHERYAGSLKQGWLETEYATYCVNGICPKVSDVEVGTSEWDSVSLWESNRHEARNGFRYLSLDRESPTYVKAFFSGSRSDLGLSIGSTSAPRSVDSQLKKEVDEAIEPPNFTDETLWQNGNSEDDTAPTIGLELTEASVEEGAPIQVRGLTASPLNPQYGDHPDIAAYVFNDGEVETSDWTLSLEVSESVDGVWNHVESLSYEGTPLDYNSGALAVWHSVRKWEDRALKFEVCSNGGDSCKELVVESPKLDLSISGGGVATVLVRSRTTGETTSCLGHDVPCLVPTRAGEVFELRVETKTGATFEGWVGRDADKCRMENGTCVISLGGGREIQAKIKDTRTPIPRVGERISPLGSEPTGMPMSADVPGLGEVIVWRDRENGAEEIRYRSLSTGALHSLNDQLGVDPADPTSTTEPKNRMRLSPSGLIAWSGVRDSRYHFYDLGTPGHPQPENYTNYRVQVPKEDFAVSDSRLIYIDEGGDSQEFYQSTSPTLNKSKLTVPEPSVSESDRSLPFLSDSHMVWIERRPGWDPRLMLYDFSNGETHDLAYNPSDTVAPVLSGNRLVWSRNDHDVYLSTFDSDWSFISSESLGSEAAWAEQTEPWIDGKIAAWMDDRHGSRKIYVRDLVGGTTYKLTTTDDFETNPHVRGRRVTWRGRDSDGHYVATYDIPDDWGQLDGGFYGDVDNDGDIESSDGLHALKLAVGTVAAITTESFKPRAADLNGKTGFDTSDALIVMKIAVGTYTLDPDGFRALSSSITLPIPNPEVFFISRIEMEAVGGGRLEASSPDAEVEGILDSVDAPSVEIDLPEPVEIEFRVDEESPSQLLGWVVSGATEQVGCGYDETCHVVTGDRTRVVGVFDGDVCARVQCTGTECALIHDCAVCNAQPLNDSACKDLSEADLSFRKDPEASGKNRFGLQAAGGPPIDPSDLGNPIAEDTDYALCIYNDASLVWGVALLGGALCELDQPCWSENGGKQFLYRDRGKPPALGLYSTKVKALSSGVDVRAKGKGSELILPNLDALADSDLVRLQIIKTEESTGERLCWEAPIARPEKYRPGRYDASLDTGETP